MAVPPPFPGNSPVWRVQSKLPDARLSGGQFVARCPTHEDSSPSLSIREGSDGRALVICRAGCPTEKVLAALGLSFSDLFEQRSGGGLVRRFQIRDRENNLIAIHDRVDIPNQPKKMGWRANGQKHLNGIKPSSLPLYRLPELLEAPKGSTVYVTEGEGKADALVDRGLVAVSTYGTGADPEPDVLAPLLDYHVILWPDNDDGGRAHMERIAARLNMHRPPRWLEWPEAPPKGDAVDYFKAGGTVAGLADLVRAWTPQQEPLPQDDEVKTIRIVNAVDLLNSEFKPPRWAVPDLLMEGLALLAGRPKLGKSWLALGLGVDVASGTPALGKIKTIPGEVLYLALEDGERRMQERLQLVLGDRPASPLLSFAYDWPKFDDNEKGMELLEEWIVAHPLARLVVIDTFKRVRPAEKGGNKRLYDLDYDALAPLAALARQHAIAIVVVFHARKGEADDPLDLVSGTTGLSGAVDAVFVLRRERGQADASLFVTGRDIEERDMAMKWHGDTADRFWWEWIGEAEDYRLSAERRQVMDVVSEMPGCKPADISGALNKTVGSIRYLLFKMVREGQVRCRNGSYYPTANAANADNAANSPSAPAQTTNDQLPVSANSIVSANSTVSGVSGPARLCRDCGWDTGSPHATRCEQCQEKWKQMDGIEELPL
jgi:hypothetical protein